MKKIKFNKYIIIGIILILFSIIGGNYKLLLNYFNDKQEEKMIQEFYQDDLSNEKTEQENIENETENAQAENKKSNYVAVLKINKINLVRGLVDESSYLNNVKYNVQIIKGSNMPDVVGGNLILAAHSGNARISYFRNLDKLEIGDGATVDYKDKTYTYKVVNIYDVDKNGKVEIKRNLSKTTLTLITCRHNTEKQIVMILELVEEDRLENKIINLRYKTILKLIKNGIDSDEKIRNIKIDDIFNIKGITTDDIKNIKLLREAIRNKNLMTFFILKEGDKDNEFKK